MTDQDNLSSILDRILAGDRTEVDIEKLRQSLRMDGDVVQLVSQDGKFNTNNGKIEGGTFHIGDVHYGADSETIERIILKALQDTLQLQSQKTLTYLTGADGLGALSDVPELPVKFLPRPDDLEPLKALLIDSSSQTSTVTEKTRKVGIQGMGGIGKSVLAAALARDKAVRRQFLNGIVWIRLGYDKVNPIGEQIKVARALTNETQSFVSIQEGKVFLENLLRDTVCLLFLDDVWHLDQIAAFNVLGDRCQMVITTRDAGIIATLGAQPLQVNVLSDDQALQLLAQASEQEIEVLPAAARTIAEECGNLPLALAMIGAMAKGDPTIWVDLLELLQTADFAEIEAEFRDQYPYPNMLRAMKVSVDALKPEEQECYLDFAVFPEDTPVPIVVLQTLWKTKGINKIKLKKIIDSLVNRSLVRQDNANQLTLHDLQLDYVRQQVKNLPALHEGLLNAYQAQCPEGWDTHSPDGYFFEWLPYHLKQAGVDRQKELQELLIDLKWLQSKLNATSSISLIADFDYFPDDQELKLVQKAIRLGVNTLSKEPMLLWSQLYGRLMGQNTPRIREMLRHNPGFPWLRSLASSLMPPDSSLIRTLEGHNSTVSDVCLVSSEKYALSASYDETLRLWDLYTGECCRILSSQSRIYCVTTTPNGEYALSGEDRVLKIWSLTTFDCIKVLEGHDGSIYDVAVFANGNRALSSSTDHTLKIWNLQTGECLLTLEDHLSWVNKVAVFPDDERAISASSDGDLKIWNLQTGKCLRTLRVGDTQVMTVALFSGGKYAISGSRDNKLRLWDLESFKCLKLIEGHIGWVNDVVTSSDSQQIVSASLDRTLKLWDLSSSQCLISLYDHSDSVKSVIFLKDEKHVLSTSFDKTLKIWSLEAAQIPHLTGHSSEIKALAVSPNQNQLLSASADQTLKLWSLESGKCLQVLEGHDNWVYDVAFLPNGSQAISASADKTLKLWDLQTGKCTHTFEGHGNWVSSVAIASSGKYALSISERSLHLLNLESYEWFKLPSEGVHQAPIDAIVAFPNGDQAVSISKDKSLVHWDLLSRKPQVLERHKAAFNAIALIPNSRCVLTASSENTLKVWSLDSGECIKILEGYASPVTHLVVASSSHYAISAHSDNVIKVWDLRSKECLTSLKGHEDKIQALSISADECYCVSVSIDGSLKWWDLRSYQLLTSWRGNSPLFSCVFASDNVTVVAGEASGRLHFLRLEEA